MNEFPFRVGLYLLVIALSCWPCVRLRFDTTHVVWWLYLLSSCGFVLSLGWLLMRPTEIPEAVVRGFSLFLEWISVLLLLENMIVTIALSETLVLVSPQELNTRIKWIRFGATTVVLLCLLGAWILHVALSGGHANPDLVEWIGWYSQALLLPLALVLVYLVMRIYARLSFNRMFWFQGHALVLWILAMEIQGDTADQPMTSWIALIQDTLQCLALILSTYPWNAIGYQATTTAPYMRLQEEVVQGSEAVASATTIMEMEPHTGSGGSSSSSPSPLAETKIRTRDEALQTENRSGRLTTPSGPERIRNRIRAEPHPRLSPERLAEPLSSKRQILSPGCVGTLYYYARFHSETKRPGTEPFQALCQSLEDLYVRESSRKRDLFRQVIQDLQDKYPWNMTLSLAMDFTTSVLDVPIQTQEGRPDISLGMAMEWALFQIHAFHDQALPKELMQNPSESMLQRLLETTFRFLQGDIESLEDEKSSHGVLPLALHDLSRLVSTPPPEDKKTTKTKSSLITETSAFLSAIRQIRHSRELLDLLDTWTQVHPQNKIHVMNSLLADASPAAMRWLYRARILVTRAFRVKPVFLLVSLVLEPERWFKSHPRPLLSAQQDLQQRLNSLASFLHPPSSSSPASLQVTQEEVDTLYRPCWNASAAGTLHHQSDVVHLAWTSLLLSWWCGHQVEFHPFRAQAMLHLLLRDPAQAGLLSSMRMAWSQVPDSIAGSVQTRLESCRFFLTPSDSRSEVAVIQELIHQSREQIFVYHDFMPCSHGTAMVRLQTLFVEQAQRARQRPLDFQKRFSIRLAFDLDVHLGLYPLHTLFRSWPPRLVSMDRTPTPLSRAFNVHNFCEALYTMYQTRTLPAQSLMYILYFQLALFHAYQAEISCFRTIHTCLREWISIECEDHIQNFVVSKQMLKQLELAADEHRRESMVFLSEQSRQCLDLESKLSIPMFVWNPWALITKPVLSRVPSSSFRLLSSPTSSPSSPPSPLSIHVDQKVPPPVGRSYSPRRQPRPPTPSMKSSASLTLRPETLIQSSLSSNPLDIQAMAHVIDSREAESIP